MKKILSLLCILIAVAVLFSCTNKKKSSTTTTTTASSGTTTTATSQDNIKPILEVIPKEVTLAYGQEYDLMTGVSALDNVDGNITSKIEVDKGDFSNTKPGQYIITYKVKDNAGNEATATRTITVLERTSVIIIDGKSYAMVYNPILNPKLAMGSDPFPWHFDLTKVSVFSKDYFDFLYEHYYDRLFAGWSNIAVTDADNKIVLLRDAMCNEYSEEVGSQVCTINNNWSNGSVTNEYQSKYGGLANLNVPENGHVIVFINDGVNAPTSPRAFGDPLMAGGAGLGKEVKFQDTEVIVDFENNQLPIITVPEPDRIKKIKVGETFDLMAGVSVTDNETEEVTLTTKIYKLNGTQYELTDLTDISTEEAGTYMVEYYAPYDETHQIYVRRQIVVEEGEVETKYLYLGEDKVPVTVNPLSWTEPNVHIYTKEFWDANAQTRSKNSYQWAVLVVTDKYGFIVEVRASWGQPFSHYTQEHPNGTTPDTNVWGKMEGWNIEVTTNLNVPEGGFVIGFGHASNTNQWRAWAYKKLLTTQDFEEVDSADPQANVTLNKSPIGVRFEGEWFTDFITFNGIIIPIEFNTSRWREYYNVKDPQLYTKEFFETEIDQSQLIYITEGNMYQNGIVIVLDKFGKVVEIRDDTNFKEFTANNPDGIEPTAWVKGKPTQNLEIPDDGFVLAYWISSVYGSYDIYRAFVHDSGSPDTANGSSNVEAIGKFASGEWFADSIIFNGTQIEVTVDSPNYPKYYSDIPNTALYTKAFWDSIDRNSLVNIGPNNFYQYSLLIILDADGKVVEIRDGLADAGGYGVHYTQEDQDGAVASFLRTEPTKDLVVPDGGYVLAFTAINGNTEVRKLGYQIFVHTSGNHSRDDKLVTDIYAVGKTVEIIIN